ncbi:hypothetical protein [Streptomyces chiangmaiensis]|uniref:Uncharacterized protein n=1 Tax=Streptomyces chiangmaiensis TaxID=766497 RepID=A0ABU7FS24_9ACTN|nr:hypothetical protein [Streptomyces chiangmaiensis]MED7826916.1 hypothetical protein [Streptomyces chiangmaiensis]
MNAADLTQRLEVLEQQLADVSRMARADRAQLTFLRGLLAGDPEPEESAPQRPVLRVLQGGASCGAPRRSDRHHLRAV